ncbi:MAG: hypothetical protein NTZ33_00420 [Bacteroidetes bacterium]|nr:hypothetical protein [Bacteroidota bacterium]
MLNLKKINYLYLLTSILIVSVYVTSCSTPQRGRSYRSHIHSGSASYYRGSSSYRMKSKRNVIPISKNYRIKNKRTSGNY